MLNLKSFEDYVNEFIETSPIVENGIFESNENFSDNVFSQISNLTGRNCVVINDVQFAASLAKKGNDVYCLYFDDDVDIPFADKLHCFQVKRPALSVSTKTVKDSIAKRIIDSFTKYNKERIVDYIFNISIKSEAAFDFQKVAVLNLFLFNTFFNPGYTTWYSFDEDKVVTEFAKKSSEKYGFKLKIQTIGQKIKGDEWYNFGFEDGTERYLTRFFISDDEMYDVVKYNGTSVEDEDINGHVDFGSTVIKGVNEPRIYAFRTDWIDDALKEQNIGVTHTALKVGDTNRDVMQRMKEWEKVFDKPHKLERLKDWSAVLSGCGDGIDGKIFRDYTVHKILENNGKIRMQEEEFGTDNLLNGRYSREFFKDCTIEDVEDAIATIKKLAIDNRYDILSRLKENTGKSEKNFIFPVHGNIKKMPKRQLQEDTIKNFENRYPETNSMLMYAVMRFGKTYTACRCMDKWAGNFNVVVSGKVGVKNEWLGTINNSSQFFEYDAYDASDGTGGLKWMLGCSDKRVKIGRDSDGNEITMRGPHPGKRFDTLEEYFEAKANIQKWWVVKGNDKYNDAYYDTEDEAIEHSNGREVEEREVTKKIVLFASLQDLMGDLKANKIKSLDDKITYIKEKHACFYEYPIDLLIIDEAHFAALSDMMGATIGEGANADKYRPDQKPEVNDEEEYDNEEGFDNDEGYNVDANPDDVDLDENDDITDKAQKETSYAFAKTINITKDTRKLYLSGTPYDLMEDEKFAEDDIIARFSFKDLMKAKNDWDKANDPKSQEWLEENDKKKDVWERLDDDEKKKYLKEHDNELPYQDENSNPYRKEKNPYFGIPKMITMGYKMDKIHSKEYCEDGVFKFKLFLETGKDEEGKIRFQHEQQILKLFKIIDGKEHDTDLMTILDVPAFKKGDMLKNIVIVLPYRRCCDAFENMMITYKNEFKHLGDYVIIKATSATDKSIDPDFAKDEVLRNVERGNNTITLTVGRLMTGVSVKPWDTMFYMRDLKKAQEYDQAKFRIQTPYIKEVSTLDVTDKGDGLVLGRTKEPTLIDMKPQTLFVDFSPRRMFDMERRRIFSHNAACGGIKDTDGVYALIEKEAEEEKDFLPTAMMENGAIHVCTPVEISERIQSQQAKIPMKKRMGALKKFPKASLAVLAMMEKVKASDTHMRGDKEIDGLLDEEDKKYLENVRKAVAAGTPLPPPPHKSKRERRKKGLSDASMSKFQENFVQQMETIMRDIFMYIILKNDDTNIPSFQRFWDSMTHVGDDKNWELVYNIFFDDLGIEEEDTLEKTVWAIKNALQIFVDCYLRPNHKVEEFVAMMVDTQNEFRNDRNAFENLQAQLKEFTRLDKKEFITPDKLLPKLTSDFVIFKESKILDLYCSKIGEVQNYFATDDKFKDNFDIDNYYMICRTKLIAELNKPVIKMLYGKKYPHKDKGKERVVNQFSKKAIDETEKFMKEHVLVYDPDGNDDVDSIISEKFGDMKFQTIIGNPPYNKGKHQIYPLFYIWAKQNCDELSMIFPSGWQDPKVYHGVGLMNTKDVKYDKQIVSIDNITNAFDGVEGAKNTNIIHWKKGYDNGLNGSQLVYTNGQNPEEKKISISKDEIERIAEVKELVACLGEFKGMDTVTTGRGPYALSTRFFKNPKDFGMADTLKDEKTNSDDIKIFGKINTDHKIKYVDKDYEFVAPHKDCHSGVWKVIIPQAWGGMSGKYMGGTYVDIYIAGPTDVCTESYFETGYCKDFEEAKKHAKYCMSKFARMLLLDNKFEFHTVKSSWKSVPVQDYSEPFWDSDDIDEIDEGLFEKYKVPEEIRQFIRDNIQPRTIKNIIGYNGESDFEKLEKTDSKTDAPESPKESPKESSKKSYEDMTDDDLRKIFSYRYKEYLGDGRNSDLYSFKEWMKAFYDDELEKLK